MSPLNREGRARGQVTFKPLVRRPFRLWILKEGVEWINFFHQIGVTRDELEFYGPIDSLSEQVGQLSWVYSRNIVVKSIIGVIFDCLWVASRRRFGNRIGVWFLGQISFPCNSSLSFHDVLGNGIHKFGSSKRLTAPIRGGALLKIGSPFF